MQSTNNCKDYFNYKYNVLTAIHEQSDDINRGVSREEDENQGAETPVVVLARTIHASEWLLVKEHTETVLVSHSLLQTVSKKAGRIFYLKDMWARDVAALTFASFMALYRAKLAPGQYRAVFGLHGSREFFSWEFWLEAPA